MCRKTSELLTSPTSVTILILGDVLAAVIFGAAIATFVITTTVAGFGVQISSPLLLSANMVVSSCCYASMGSMFSALPTDKPANVMMLSNVIRLPIIFVSGVFVPLENLPNWGRLLSFASPVTYTTDLMRYTLGGGSVISPNLALLALVGFTTVFLAGSIYFHARTIRSRI
ncbi:MAG: ABC transporter permease [Dissulfuribacterales bacterium]